jgi:predicted Zn-dependent peptidase
MKKIISILTIITFISNISAQEKEIPPEGGTPKGFTLPEKEVITFDNGLTLVMIPYGAIPKTTINVTIKTGNIHEQEDQVWLSDLMADLMEEGSTTQNTKTIANKMASMGGNLNISVGVHTMTLSTNVLSEFAPDAIAIIADVLQNPSWPSEELDRLKNDMKRSVQVSLSRPQSQANQDFFASVYPNHPYGRIYPSIEQIESYSVNSIKSFYNSNIGGKRTTVYIVGKFNKNEVENAVTDAFENWIEGPDEFYPVAQALTENKVKIIDRPGAPQSTIYFGLPVADPSDPDYTSLDVTNAILGGSFGSRITSNIREDKGYTYSPRSVLATNYKTGLWYEVADVTTEFTGASLDEIKKEIYRLQNEAPSDEELDGIKNYQTGIYVLQNSTPGGIIGQLNFLDIHELEDSYLINRVQNLLAVSPQDVQEMTKKYINPEKMTLIVVGDKVKIEKQIEETLKEKIKQ